jgi:hypothetical protein
MELSARKGDFAVGAAIIALALAVSPIGIRLVTGRIDLSARVTVLSLAFDVFLLVLAGAALTTGRARQAFFRLLVCVSPVLLLAAIETGALAVHLADRVAPIEDLSIVANKKPWPPHLMSLGRWTVRDGVLLYQPFQADGIAINELGLRTPPPSPKKAGEWRIAVTGGSVVFGWRLLDDDTLPVQLQQILHRQGHSNVTVYNFGIDSIKIEAELDVLKRFREIYGIDQVVFFTGANDASYAYTNTTLPADRASGIVSGVNAFELIKVASRLRPMLLGPSPDLLATLDNELLPELARDNTLRDGLIAAADYCRAVPLPCDFVLQPILLRRNEPRGPEIRIARTLKQLYPRYDQAFATMYGTALSTGLRVHDSSDLFDQSVEPYFFDVAHLNEAGNRLAAERIARIVSGSLPKHGEGTSGRR